MPLCKCVDIVGPVGAEVASHVRDVFGIAEGGFHMEYPLRVPPGISARG